jgi:hypothetical protein
MPCASDVWATAFTPASSTTFASTPATFSPEAITRLYKLGATTKIATTIDTQPTLQTGLVGHWTFDGPDMDWANEGAEVRDRSGQGNHGALEGGMTQNAARRDVLGQALQFTGTGGFIDVGNVGSGIHTVAFWMYADSATEDILQLSDTASVSLADNTITTEGFGTHTIYVDGEQSSSVSAGTWHHVTVVADTAVTADAVRLGRVGDSFYTGLLDDVRIYDRALSEDEITDLYRLGR